MTAVLGRGTCGGHVTLLFTVDDLEADPMTQGSLGAGLCLADGAEAIARAESGEYSLKVKFLDGNGDSSMFQQVLDLLREDIPAITAHSWEIASRNQLPSSQGFGMSAAGAVAAAVAFQRALGLPHEESMRRSFAIAHLVESHNSTGLGDVTALAAGNNAPAKLSLGETCILLFTAPTSAVGAIVDSNVGILGIIDSLIC